MANQVNRGFHHAGEIGCGAVTVDVHVKDSGVLKEEMVVKSCHLEPVVQKGGHHGIYLVFEKHQIAHHHVAVRGAFRHGEPASKAKGRGSGDAVDCDLQIAPGNVDLQ